MSAAEKDVVTSDNLKVKQGCFTPWAAIVCLGCDKKGLEETPGRAHYEKRLAKLRALDAEALVDCPEGDLLAMCDTCREPCWVRADVAILQRLGYRISELDWEGPHGWRIAQTGGMCAALIMTTTVTPANREIVATAMDGPLYIGEYDSEEWVDPIRSEEIESSTDRDPDALREAIDCAARTMIEWACHPKGDR